MSLCAISFFNFTSEVALATFLVTDKVKPKNYLTDNDNVKPK